MGEPRVPKVQLGSHYENEKLFLMDGHGTSESMRTLRPRRVEEEERRHTMSTWLQGRRRYGPYCDGSVYGFPETRQWFWNLLFLMREPQEPLRLTQDEFKFTTRGEETSRHKAQAACDAMVTAWQARFPGLRIVGDDPPEGGDEHDL